MTKGMAAMLVYTTKECRYNSIVIVHQHGGYDLKCKPCKTSTGNRITAVNDFKKSIPKSSATKFFKLPCFYFNFLNGCFYIGACSLSRVTAETLSTSHTSVLPSQHAPRPCGHYGRVER